MGELTGIYAMWYRELKVFTREKSRVISSIINPMLWLLIFGGGLGATVSISGINYQTFIYPGVLAQTVLFSSIFFGVYIVWDRKIDFLKEVLIAPLSRTSIFLGKVIGGTTDSMLQILILFILGYVFAVVGIIPGLSLNILNVLISFAILFLTTIGLVSIGLIIGSQMESPEGFQLIGSFLLFPLFFFSGALFPIDNLPAWLMPFTSLDPVTYTVDALRGTILGASHFPLVFDFAVICLFSLATIFAGTFAFKRMKI